MEGEYRQMELPNFTKWPTFSLSVTTPVSTTTTTRKCTRRLGSPPRYVETPFPHVTCYFSGCRNSFFRFQHVTCHFIATQFYYSTQVAMKVLVEKMNVTGLDFSKYTKGQLATASSDDIASKFKKVRHVS